MRTIIDLDEELIEKAMRYSKARTKRALVEEALRHSSISKIVSSGDRPMPIAWLRFVLAPIPSA